MARAATTGAVAAGLAVLAALAAVAVTAAGSSSLESPDTSPQIVPASSAQLSCPETTLGRKVTAGVLAVAPPAEAGPKTAGKISIAPLAAKATQREPIGGTEQVGSAVSSALDDSARPSVTVTASGGLAAGAYAAQRTTLSGSRNEGLAVASCPSPADEWWYTGVDTSVGSTTRLVLSNPTPAVAVVDLSFYGPKGTVSAVGARGIPVAPQSRTTLDLARFAPGLDAVTVQVSATRGRVAAAVNLARVNGVTSAGNEWLAPSKPPSDDVLVNAGDSGSGDQRLVITNTTGRDELVAVQVLDKDGPFTPKGLTGLRIKPHRTVVRDLSDVTDTSAAALRLTTQGGLTATLVSDSARPPVELSTSSSSPALDDPAVVPVFGGTRVSLAFATHEDGGGAVRIQAYDARGRPVGEPDRVSVRADTTRVWAGPAPRKAAYLVVTVADGRGVHGVATYHGKTGQSAIPVVSGTWTVTRPAVRPAS